MEKLRRKRKNLRYIGLICSFLVLFNYVGSQPVRTELQELYTSQIGVREATGNNDGKEVKMYLNSVGLDEGYPWCAAFVSWCHLELIIPSPVSAWSPSWFGQNVIYKKDWRKPQFTAKPGMVFGLYYASKKRVAHVGFIDYEDKNNYYTVEGNTNKAGSREGDGVYRKIRPKNTVYIVADYCLSPRKFIKTYSSIISDGYKEERKETKQTIVIGYNGTGKSTLIKKSLILICQSPKEKP